VALDLPAIQTGQLYDIQDVQIMRGPQGTGPFRNASAGAIRVQSNLPTGTTARSCARASADMPRMAARARITR
jgi:hypothetical protein